MHHTHTPHPPDESAPTVAMALGGLPGQRLPSDAPVLDEATREVPVIRPPDADEQDAGEDPAAAPEADGDDPTGAEAQANGDAHDDQPEETADAGDDPGADDAVETDAEPAAEMDTDLGSAPYAAAETAVVDEPLAVPGAEVEAEADDEDQPYAEADTGAAADVAAEPYAEAEPEVEAEADDADQPDAEAEPEVEAEADDADRPAEPTEPEAEAEDGPTADIDVEEEPMFYAATTEEVEETGDAAPPATVVGHLSALEGDLTDEEPAAEEPSADEAEAEAATAEEVTAEEVTAEETPAEPAPLRPGDLVEMPIALWTAEAAQRFRDEWRELQVLFIDEPAVAVAEAKNLVTEVVHTLSDTLLSEQDEFDPRRSTANPDTEAMRVAMRRYRDFLERVLAL